MNAILGFGGLVLVGGWLFPGESFFLSFLKGFRTAFDAGFFTPSLSFLEKEKEKSRISSFGCLSFSIGSSFIFGFWG